MRRSSIFRGRVQGVGFRATVRRLAADYRVTGWVRNEPDGSVAMEAQGEPAELDRFTAAIERVMARNIASTSHSEITQLPQESGFTIRH